MGRKLISIYMSDEDVERIDSKWRPNLEYKSRADYIRAKLNMRRTYSKSED